MIQLSGQALEAAQLQEAQSRSVERILKGAGTINRLMNDLSILVRSRMRVQLPLARVDADLGEICELTLETVKASHADTVFALKTFGDLHGTWDRERLGQVIFNLVVNAVIHASAKHVQIIAEAQGSDVVLQVTNQGTPIPDDRQMSIFEQFVHTDTESAALPKRGLGLGLFIVNEIVIGHEGIVKVTSNASEGTSFIVRLPRAPSSRAERPSSEDAG